MRGGFRGFRNRWSEKIRKFATIFVFLHQRRDKSAVLPPLIKKDESFEIWRQRRWAAASRIKDVAKLITERGRNIIVLSSMSGTINTLVGDLLRLSL